MKEIEKNESQAREKYEPMEIKVMKVTHFSSKPMNGVTESSPM